GTARHGDAGGSALSPAGAGPVHRGAGPAESLPRRGAASRGVLWDTRDAFDERLLDLAARQRAVPAYRRLAKHLWRHAESWFSFLTGRSIPATNWPPEQAIRPAVVNRKVWGGNRTAAGARAQGVLLSVIETCRPQGPPAPHIC